MRRSAKQRREPQSRTLLMFRFVYFEKLIGTDLIECLAEAGRPCNLDFRVLGRTETKMKSFVAGGKIASGRSSKSRLPVDANPRTQAIPITSFAPQSNCEPMLRAATVHQYERRPAKHSDD